MLQRLGSVASLPILGICGTVSAAILAARFGHLERLWAGLFREKAELHPRRGSEIEGFIGWWGNLMSMLNSEGHEQYEPAESMAVPRHNIMACLSHTGRRFSSSSQTDAEMAPKLDAASELVLDQLLALPDEELEPPQHRISCSIKPVTDRRWSEDSLNPQSVGEILHAPMQSNSPLASEISWSCPKGHCKSPLNVNAADDIVMFHKSLEEFAIRDEQDFLADPATYLNTLPKRSTPLPWQRTKSKPIRRLGNEEPGIKRLGSGITRSQSMEVDTRTTHLDLHISRASSQPVPLKHQQMRSKERPANLLGKYTKDDLVSTSQKKLELAAGALSRGRYNKLMGELLDSDSDEWA